MRKKIIIMGAGVGGLTVAHLLINSKQNFEIHIIERNDEVGGLARSRRLPNDLHSEYCWHVIGKNYHNLWKIMKEIPYENKTVADNLVPIRQYIYGRENDNEPLDEINSSFLCSGSIIKYCKALHKMGTLKDVTLYDLIKLLEITSICNTSSLEMLKHYDSILWKDFTKHMSAEAKKWITDSPAIYLGMDIDKLSAHTMLHLLRPIIEDETKYDFYSFDGSFNDKWFEPWKKNLSWLGVIFHKGTIDRIKVIDDEIQYVSINSEKMMGHVYINALSVESLALLVPRYRELSCKSVQIQTQVLYYINKKLKFKYPSILIFPDTPWCIMVRPEGMLWKYPTISEESQLNTQTDFDYKDILSTGIGIWSRPGILHKKPAIECTIDEIKEECWYQIRRSKRLCDYIETESDEHSSFDNFSNVQVLHADIWDSFTYRNDQIETWEPKFSNNVGTLKLRPTSDDLHIKNLKHATAYTQTNANIFNMESACEAGCRVANSLDPELKFFDKRDKPTFGFKFIQSL